jgi:hypothetical protein
MLLKVGSTPRVQDLLQLEWFIDDFLNLGEEIIRDLDRPREDAYRDCVEFRRRDLRDICGRLLNKLHGTEERTPRAVLLSLPAQARAKE